MASALVIVILQFTYTVCEDQVAETEVVEVCRGLAITDPIVAVLGLGMLVSASFWFSEISGFGITLKRQVEKAQETADRAVEKAAEAKGASQSAERMAETAQGFRREVASQPASEWLSEADAVEHARRLAGEYDETRATLGQGVERTARMTGLVSGMIGIFSSVSVEATTVEPWLEGSAGERLAAYVFSYVSPDASIVSRLVHAAVEESQGFAQYWALRSLRSVIESTTAVLSPGDRRALEGLHDRLGVASDRGYELAKILDASR